MTAKKESASVEVVAPAATSKSKLLSAFADRYELDAVTVPDMLRKTAFPDAKSNAELMAMLTVANAYQLNPFVREIYAFVKDGRVMPVVSIDGWLRVINEHPQYDGMELNYAPDMVKVGNSKPCPEWIECVIYRKDRTRPTAVREYFEECYRSTPPWNQTPKRMLRHRAIIQAGRVAFGLSFIDPEDEVRIKAGVDIIDGVLAPDEERPGGNAAMARELLGATPTPSEPSEAPTGAAVAADEPSEDQSSDEDEELAALDAISVQPGAEEALEGEVVAEDEDGAEEGEQGTLA